MKNGFTLKILPRQNMTWKEFARISPPNSIALDGVVSGGPRFDPDGPRINFDHHDGVVREATMSTAMQVYTAIKGGLMESFRKNGQPQAAIFINDTDQDTSLAVWLLDNHKLFEGTGSIPCISRLLALTDRLDISGGAYPMNLDERIVSQHNWVFRPYTDLRKSGALAQANETVLADNLDAVMNRLNRLLMGQAEEVELDTRHVILYNGADFKVVDEIGGNEARYYLYSKGMNAFISIVARRPDGNMVVSVGRRSRFIPFPIRQLYEDFNRAEGLAPDKGWDGSDIIGGSPRATGTSLTWEKLRDIALERLARVKE